MTSTANDVPFKVGAKLNTCPEDISVIIIESIRRFADVSHKDEQERIKGFLARNSTLRSVSLTSKSIHRLYHEATFQNINLYPQELYSFYRLIKDHPELGLRIKTFNLLKDERIGIRIPEEDEDLKQLNEKQQGMAIMKFLFTAIKNVEILSIDEMETNFPFGESVGDAMVPFHFFLHSLKRLKIGPHTSGWASVLASQAVWLLVHCETLQQAVLQIDIQPSDVYWLEESLDWYQGRSNVKDLAITINYAIGKRDEQSYIEEFGEPETGPTAREESTHNFLRVTSQLSSFEIFSFNNDNASRDPDLPATLDTLEGLESSFSTLKQVRLLSLNPTAHFFDMSKLTSLTHLSLNEELLMILDSRPEFQLPPSLETLEMPFYGYNWNRDDQEISEEKLLSNLLERRSIPHLKEVNVPVDPIDWVSRLAEQEVSTKSWKEERARLEGLEIFKGKKVKLTKSKLGEKVGSQNGVSVFGFLNSFQL